MDEKLLQRIQMNYTGKSRATLILPAFSPVIEPEGIPVPVKRVSAWKDLASGFFGWLVYDLGAFIVIFIAMVIKLSSLFTWMAMIALVAVLVTTVWITVSLAFRGRYWVIIGAGLAMALNLSLWVREIGPVSHMSDLGWPGGAFFFAFIPYPVGYLLFMC